MRKNIILSCIVCVILLAIGLTTAQQSNEWPTDQNIIFLTKKEWRQYGTWGPYADSFYVADLRNAGYSVFVPPYEDVVTIDAYEAARLKAADLVILGRGISSGDFDDEDDSIWAELSTPIMLMSNYTARGKRLKWVRSSSKLNFSRFDTLYAKIEDPSDPIFAGIDIPEDSVVAFATRNLGLLDKAYADSNAINGKVLATLYDAKGDTAYKIDGMTGDTTGVYPIADYQGLILMARWAPGDSMYSGVDEKGKASVINQGWRSLLYAGNDNDYAEPGSPWYDEAAGVMWTNIMNFYVHTDLMKRVWLNEVANLIETSNKSNAELDAILINGQQLPGFDPEVDTYDYRLPISKESVQAIAQNPDASVEMTESKGQITITITSQDGSTTKTYVINFPEEGEGHIVFLTKKEWRQYNSFGPYADSMYVADLRNFGYDVEVPPYDDFTTVGPDQKAALEAADLIILSRGISSGDFDDEDDSIWAELKTPIMLMSNYTARGKRLKWVRSSSKLNFSRFDTLYAKIEDPGDPIFAGIDIPEDSIVAFATRNLGLLDKAYADSNAINGKVLATLYDAKGDTAYKIDGMTGDTTGVYPIADYQGLILMARWAPGDSMYSGVDEKGKASVVNQGWRSLLFAGNDNDYAEPGSPWYDEAAGVMWTNIMNFYVHTDLMKRVWLNEVKYLIEQSKTSVKEDATPEELPQSYALKQNYPNPFNPTTKISFSLPKAGHIELNIYNVMGQKVATLINKNMNAGQYTIEFHADNLGSGIYYYQLKSDAYQKTKKMVVLK